MEFDDTTDLEAKLIAYLSDSSLKNTTPSITVKANSDDDITSIKKALTNSSVTNNVAGVELVLTTGLTSLPSSAFMNCRKLTSVEIPDGVTSIENQTFQECTSLTSVTIPNSVTSINRAAFNDCSALTSISVESGNTMYVSEDGVLFNKGKTSLIVYPAGKSGASYVIPDSVETIGNYAFRNCRRLTSVTIPDSVKTIGSYAFDGCSGLKSFSVKSGSTEYEADGGVLFNKDKTSLLAYPVGKSGSYVIPDSVETIGSSAFSSCYNLTSVTIPDSVKTIGSSAFSSCIGLTSVTIGSSVDTIGSFAFENCIRLPSVTIPASVKTIGNYAFSGCRNLEIVTVSATTPPELGSRAFYNGAGKILVPAESVDDYKAASGWSDYKSIIY